MAVGVAARDFERGGRYVCRNDSRLGQFVRQRDRDAAGAGAHIRDLKVHRGGAVNRFRR